jgi:hypothetical protein
VPGQRSVSVRGKQGERLTASDFRFRAAPLEAMKPLDALFLKHEGCPGRMALEDIHFISALKDYFSVLLTECRYLMHGTM